MDAAARINGKFAPGHSGNPRGRPRETPEEFALLSEIRSLSDKAEKALESVFDNPDAPADAKIKAANIVIERQLGKRRQEIDQNVTQNITTPADFRPDLSDLRRKAIAFTDPSPDTFGADLRMGGTGIADCEAIVRATELPTAGQR